MFTSYNLEYFLLITYLEYDKNIYLKYDANICLQYDTNNYLTAWYELYTSEYVYPFTELATEVEEAEKGKCKIEKFLISNVNKRKLW